MAFFEDLAKGELLSGDVLGGLAIGAAALVVVPFAVPLLRPLAKTVIKGGLYAYDSAAQLYNQGAAGVDDVVAEAQRELGATSAPTATTTPTASSPQRGRAATATG